MLVPGSDDTPGPCGADAPLAEKGNCVCKENRRPVETDGAPRASTGVELTEAADHPWRTGDVTPREIADEKETLEPELV